MSDPFGINKSFTKLAPKLGRALRAVDPATSTNMTTKLGHHGGSLRMASGSVGRRYGRDAKSLLPITNPGGDKKTANALYAASTRSKKRQLP